jgi:hypothetical protein
MSTAAWPTAAAAGGLRFARTITVQLPLTSSAALMPGPTAAEADAALGRPTPSAPAGGGHDGPWSAHAAHELVLDDQDAASAGHGTVYGEVVKQL